MATEPACAPYQRRRHSAFIRRRRPRAEQPAPTVAALLIPTLPRAELGRLVHRMIDRMDYMDGDPDLEPCGALEDIGSNVLPFGKIGLVRNPDDVDAEDDDPREDDESDGRIVGC